MKMPIDGRNWIAGDWVAGQGEPWERRSPSDESLVWKGAWASADQALQAMQAARAAFPAWADAALEDRIAYCRRFGQLVNERREELAHCIAVENGKPLWEARTEVAAAIAKVENSVESILERRWTRTQTIGDYQAVTRYKPHGVMFVIGPFNFPAHVPGGHIIPALLAGNTVVFKPSEYVPACGQWLTQIWQDTGLPPGVFNLVHGATEVGETLVADPQVDGVLFTGSQAVGTRIHAKLAGQPQRVLALEMGGNNPLVVHDPADDAAAALTIILSAFLTAGQRCTCTRRLIISGDRAYANVLDELQRKIPRIRCGLSLDEPQPFMGPMIAAKAADDMLRAQQQLVDQGARMLVEMRADKRSKALVTPALLAVDPDVQIDDCEYFGPLLMVHRADDLEDAIAIANRTRYGLSAGFIGQNSLDFERFLRGVRAGIVNWNRQTTGASGKLPFGGVGISGNHHPSGYHAADYCSFPVASLESPSLSEDQNAFPGLDWDA